MKMEDLLTKGSSSPQEEDDEDEKVELKAKVAIASDEGVENAEDAVEECVEKESAGGKKKGTRKKRSLNWEEAERGLLLDVIKSKVAFVENRSVDAKSIKAKRLAWSQITKQFNALNFRHRLLEQIQVQWRSMKNSAKREHQQKHPKSDPLEGMRMIEFMEEMQKDPVTARSQTRGANTNGGTVSTLKKELLDIDEDEDMPLAALPNSTNASEDTLQTSTMAIPSPPPSTAGGDGDSQHESAPSQPPTQRRKRAKPKSAVNKNDSGDMGEENEKAAPVRKRRQRNLSQAQSVISDENEASTTVAPSTTPQQFSSAATTVPETNSPPAAPHDLISSTDMEQKYKHDLFKLLKQARLAEIDYARREHEQKLRLEQMEQEIKMAYYRQEQDLKLRHMREEHDIRLRQQRREHEARLAIYSLKCSGLNGSIQEQIPLPSAKCNAKLDYNNVHMDGETVKPSTSAEGTQALSAACN
ncbi:ABC transporter F family member 4 [Drosophila guanche]|uniref:Regulatory protein zeste n=1 Tax=Drosophila guanche TaxID=7266 RepID=A0A3B0JJX9_DROGU|nr:ABC transporter F family member 4 [Drosophila guanche]SPP73749.1 blast:Protein CLP1 homolog [Drosophila guanche]